MKRIIFIISLFCICVCCQHVIHDHGIVQEVKNNHVDNKWTKYHYTMIVDVSDNVTGTIKVLTNTLYQVGDTIKFNKTK